MEDAPRRHGGRKRARVAAARLPCIAEHESVPAEEDYRAGRSVTVFQRRAFLRYILRRRRETETLIRQFEEEEAARKRKSLNSLTEEEQLLLAIRMSTAGGSAAE